MMAPGRKISISSAGGFINLGDVLSQVDEGNDKEDDVEGEDYLVDVGDNESTAGHSELADLKEDDGKYGFHSFHGKKVMSKSPRSLLRTSAALFEESSVEPEDGSRPDGNVPREPQKKEVQELVCHKGHSVKLDNRRIMCIDCKIRICPECRYNISGNVKSHFLGHPKLGTQKLHCAVCQLFLPTPCGLKAHERLHRIDAPFVCPDCGFHYMNLRFFLAHSVERCFHLFRTNIFECSLCSKGNNEGKFTSLQEYRRHQRTHIGYKFRCRVCLEDVGVNRLKAIHHLKVVHMLNKSSDKISKYLEMKHICDYCSEVVDRNHWVEHTTSTAMKGFLCTCGEMFNSIIGFKNHRFRSCDAPRNQIPKAWADLTRVAPKVFHTEPLQPVVKQKICEFCDRAISGEDSLCKECMELISNQEEVQCMCLGCQELMTYDTGGSGFCRQCRRQGYNLCCECSEVFKAEECDDESRSLFPMRCTACIAVTETLSEWIASEEVLDGGNPSFDSLIPIEYIHQPLEHDYCIPHDFPARLRTELYAQRHINGHLSMKIPANVNESSEPLAPKNTGPTRPKSPVPKFETPEKSSLKFGVMQAKRNKISCPICFVNITESIYDLHTHFMYRHANAVLDVTIPDNNPVTCPVANDDDDVDLCTRMKRLKEQEKEIKKEKAGDDVNLTPRKRMRLYVPKETKEKPEEDKSIEEVKNTPEEAKKEVDPKPKEEELEPKGKEHEFWDQYNGFLSKLDGGRHKDVQGEMPTYTSKRRVKKPKRLVEEEDEELETTKVTKKVSKSDNELSSPEVKKPVKTKERRESDKGVEKRKEVEKGSQDKQKDSQNDEVDVIVEKKVAKRRAIDFDTDQVAVRDKLNKDVEIGFIRKMLNSDSHKRKLRPSARLQALMGDEDNPVVDLLSSSSQEANDEWTCLFCNEIHTDLDSFRKHIIIHRTDENTFQCMECGECFVVCSTLEKHLRAFHKITDTGKYIEDNKCNVKLVNKDGGPVVEEKELEPNQCRVCREIFPSSVDLNLHFRSHDSLNAKCVEDKKLNMRAVSECGGPVVEEKELEPNQCRVCREFFPTWVDLNLRFQSHGMMSVIKYGGPVVEEKKLEPYQCPECRDFFRPRWT